VLGVVTGCPDRPLDLPDPSVVFAPVDLSIADRHIGDAKPAEDFAVGGELDAAVAPVEDLSQRRPTDGPPAIPRLIAPLSTATVTLQRPTLHWQLGSGAGTPVVDLCADRACTRPLSVSADVAPSGLSAVPGAALPPGWIFWRVRVVSGSMTAVSPTWQFWVNSTSASSGVDTSSGTVLDVNGDGYTDFLVGDSLTAHLYLGNASGSGFTDIRIDLPVPDGSYSFVHTAGYAGDVNGDGFADFMIGNDLFLGEANIDAADWNGASAPRRISFSAQPNFSWYAMTSIGDANGDGYADFLVAGEDHAAYLFFGEANPQSSDWMGTAPPLQVVLTDPSKVTYEEFGMTVAGAGDVNGDGYGDFLVGTPSTGAGANQAWVYLYLGAPAAGAGDWNATASSLRIQLSDPDTGGPDAVAGGYANEISSAGDLNNDGYTDFLVNAYVANRVHVYLGGAAPAASAWNGAAPSRRLDVIMPSPPAFVAYWSVQRVGDVNGDGSDDFLVGRGDYNSPGSANLYLGGTSLSVANWNGASPSKRIDLATPAGSMGQFGYSVLGPGDLNGDGFADFLVGATGAHGGSGAAYVYSGESVPSVSDWNGSAPPRRLEMLDPDRFGTGFGDLR
jgi:hypothetical protein